VTAAPPSSVGDDQEIDAEASPNTAEVTFGAPGTVAGTSAAEGFEVGPVPAEFVAVTRKMYCCPFVRPLTTHELKPLAAGLAEHVRPPGNEVTK
jgi:hypothetical protein